MSRSEIGVNLEEVVMKIILRKIIGVLIALLAIAGFSIWAIPNSSAPWWQWLGVTGFGIFLVGLGVQLIASFKDFVKGLKNPYLPF